MPEALTDTELDETDRWAKAYRSLMKGGLGATVHTAGVGRFADPGDEDRFPTLRVDVVEQLLAEVRRLRSEVTHLNACHDAAVGALHTARACLAALKATPRGDSFNYGGDL